MRITGGIGRGLPLRVPRGKGTRPATDQLREAVFSSLGRTVESARVLDLFAGSGAYGLESVSRGSRDAVFVENDRRALAELKRNIATLAHAFTAQGAPAPAMRVIPRDVRRLSFDGHTCDLIFCDPPYGEIDALCPDLMRRLRETSGGRLRLFVLELPGGLDWSPPGWILRKRLGKRAVDAPNAAIFETGARVDRGR